MSTQSLCFNEVTFTPITQDNQVWIQARQLACALGYKDERSVHKIYERNKDEFSSMMSAVVNLTTGFSEVPVRVFSLRGCHLVAMFARTPVAKAFRKWVLDVLDKLSIRVEPASERHRRPTRKAYPCGTKRIEEIRARIDALRCYAKNEKFRIVNDLLSCFNSREDNRYGDILREPVHKMLEEIIGTGTDASFKYNNPCDIVLQMKELLER